MGDGLKFIVNGDRIDAPDIAPTTTLLDWLRYEKGLTGTKEGCAEGDCGACTVVIRELDETGALRQRTANACIQLLPMVHGREVVTVEALAEKGAPHPVQRAMAEGHGSQCGFCTPGFVMSLWSGYEAGASTDPDAVADQLAGNLCRCTGYGPIIAAAAAARAAPKAASDVREATARLKTLKAGPLDQKGPGGWFRAPRKADDLAALIEAEPHATILAGATDIGLWINKNGFRPEKIIWIGDCADLDRIEQAETGDGVAGVRIGAAVSHERAMAALGELYPDMGELWRRFASVQVRSAGTLCGNIANGSPIGDAPPALIAAGAMVTLRAGPNRRTMPLEEFFVAYGVQNRQPGEFVESVFVPKPAGDPIALRCYKISKRFDQDITAVLAAINIEEVDGVVASARIAFGGMAATPKRAEGAERALLGRKLDDAAMSEAITALGEDFSPIDDHRASAEYREKVARNLLLKYLLERRFGDIRVTGRGRVMAAE